LCVFVNRYPSWNGERKCVGLSMSKWVVWWRHGSGHGWWSSKGGHGGQSQRSMLFHRSWGENEGRWNTRLTLSPTLMDYSLNQTIKIWHRRILELDCLQQVIHKGTQTQNGSPIVLNRPPTEYLYRRPILSAKRDTT
jgi:hypothetical protein